MCFLRRWQIRRGRPNTCSNQIWSDFSYIDSSWVRYFGNWPYCPFSYKLNCVSPLGFCCTILPFLNNFFCSKKNNFFFNLNLPLDKNYTCVLISIISPSLDFSSFVFTGSSTITWKLMPNFFREKCRSNEFVSVLVQCSSKIYCFWTSLSFW